MWLFVVRKVEKSFIIILGPMGRILQLNEAQDAEIALVVENVMRSGCECIRVEWIETFFIGSVQSFIFLNIKAVEHKSTNLIY